MYDTQHCHGGTHPFITLNIFLLTYILLTNELLKIMEMIVDSAYTAPVLSLQEIGPLLLQYSFGGFSEELDLRALERFVNESKGAHIILGTQRFNDPEQDLVGQRL